MTVAYTLALFLVAALSTGTYLSLGLLLQVQAQDATLINVSGRQRMLGQRAGMLAAELLRSEDDATRVATRDLLAQVVNQLARAHEGLLRGDAGLELTGHPGPAAADHLFRPPGRLDDRTSGYLAALRFLLHTPDPDGPAGREAAARVREAAHGPLLAAQEEAVAIYTREATGHVETVRRAETIAWVLTLLTLGAEALFIFHPLTRRVRRERARLKLALARRARAEAEGRERAEFLGVLLANVQAGIYACNARGEIVHTNRAANRFYGRGEEQVPAERWIDHYAVFEADGVTPMALGDVPLWRALHGECPRDVELVIRPEGAPECRLNVNAQPFHDPTGRLLGAVAVAHDITALRAAEQASTVARDAALASARMKGEFLANMSHEIRTPMNGVIGMVELLLDTPLSAEQRDMAETVRGSGEALLTILNDILDLSKVEAGMMRFERLDFDPRGTVEETLALLANRAAGKGLSLAAYVDDAVAGTLRGDSHRLRQVLTNLIGNALKFTEAGEVFVEVRNEAETAEGRPVLRFEVRDTGIGISPQAQQRLFQSFSQADGSTTRKYGGTGLGLTISRQLVEGMGGQIGLESTPDIGSTFWFTLPFEVGATLDAGPVDAADAENAALAARLAATRVLIVDDLETNRRIMRQFLRGIGGPGATRPPGLDGEAAGAAEALDLLVREAAGGRPFGLVILDMQMPGMDGAGLARAIRADPALAGTKLLLATSLDQRGDADGIPVDARILKPLRRTQFIRCLIRLLPLDATPAGVVPRVRVEGGPAAEPTTGPPHGLGLRVLLAEDNAVNQRVARRQLEGLGCHVTVVDDGVAAVEAFVAAADSPESFDAILMDAQMPRMDGYATAAAIRREESVRGRGEAVLIIALTASAMEGERKRCLEAGMNDYLSKPVKIASLQTVFGALRESGAGPSSGAVSRA